MRQARSRNVDVSPTTISFIMAHEAVFSGQ